MAVVGIALLGCRTARADLMGISIQTPVNINAGSSGSAEVYLTDLSATGTGVTIGAFSFELQALSPDVQFTAATTNSTTPYILSGNSFVDATASGDLTSQTSPDLIAGDFALNPFTGTFVAPGDKLALGVVSFSVSPTAPTESVVLTFVAGPNTVIADPAGSTIAIESLSGGAINITGESPNPVPEASSLSLLLIVIASLAPIMRRTLARRV